MLLTLLFSVVIAGKIIDFGKVLKLIEKADSICPSCTIMQMQGARGACAHRALVMHVTDIGIHMISNRVTKLCNNIF